MTQQNTPDEEKKQEKDQKSEQKTERIIELGSSVVTNCHGTIHCLTIIGQIEGHTNAPENAKTTKYEHLLPLLASLEESDEVDGVLILLNTVGGDVEAGLALAEMIAGMTKPAGAGRRTLHRYSFGSLREDQYDRALGLYDRPSCAHERDHDRCAPDLSLF